MTRQSLTQFYWYCSAWLENTDDELIAKVNRRIGAVTGLDMSTAEPLQVYSVLQLISIFVSCSVVFRS